MARMLKDCILITSELPEKLEVDQLAAELSIDHDAAIGKLVRFWIWWKGALNHQAEKGIEDDCNVLRVTAAFIDRVSDAPGLADALVRVGWLVRRKGGYEAPRSEKYISQTAVNKEITRRRVERLRDAQCNGVVTPEALQENDGSHIESSPKPPSSKTFKPPSLEEVRAYCLERGNNVDPEQFVDFYTGKGWIVGKTRMKDWRACVRTWEKNDASAGSKKRDPRGNLAAGDEYLRQKEAMAQK